MEDNHKSSFQKRLERKIQEAEEEKIKSEIKNKLLEEMKAKGVKIPPERTPTENFIIKSITLIIAAPLTALIFLGALAWGAFAWGFVLYKFWQWFLLPVFPTLPHISISQAVGLMIVVQLFDKNIPQVFDDEFLNTDKKNYFDIISPIIAFVFGWIVWFFLIPLGF